MAPTPTNETETAASSNGGFTAPYTSFQTFMRAVDRMNEQGGAPSRVDRSYLSNLPGGAQTIFQSSMKSLGLITEDLKPTARLEALVDAKPEERKRLIGELVREHYPGPLSLGERATQQQLEDEFRKLNVTGSTMRKAIGFFLNASRFAGIGLSPNFKLPKVAPSASPRKRAARNGGSGAPPPAEEKPPLRQATNLPTLVQGLVERLPKEGEVWSSEEAEQWLEIARLTFPFVYGYQASPKAKGGDAT